MLHTETSSSNDDSGLDSIGNFNTHEANLNVANFYLYEVTDAQDWDEDANGVIDIQPATNSGIIRAFVSGDIVKRAGISFIVSYVSELAFKSISQELKEPNLTNYKFNALITSVATNTFALDINSDSSIDGFDTALFNPVSDVKLSAYVQANQQHIIDGLHSGDIAIPKPFPQWLTIMHVALPCITDLKVITEDNATITKNVYMAAGAFGL